MNKCKMCSKEVDRLVKFLNLDTGLIAVGCSDCRRVYITKGCGLVYLSNDWDGIVEVLDMYCKHQVGLSRGDWCAANRWTRDVTINIRELYEEALLLRLHVVSVLFATLLHELGHFLCPKSTYTSGLTIFAKEEEAWKAGEEAYSGEYPDGYDLVKASCLLTYSGC